MGPAESLRELKAGESPEGASWYALGLLGEGPCARVGHSALYVAPRRRDPKGGGGSSSSSQGKVVIVGGADPSGSFADLYFLDLDAYRWTRPLWEGLLPRYEHAAFTAASRPTNLWVYGGTSETGNRSCVQVLDLETGRWERPQVIGTPPSPRTFHTNSAVIGDRLYVFGGGNKGVDPVQDQQLHVFDTATLAWLQPEVRGNPPAPRHGHAVVTVGSKLFIHGGLAGDTFYSDLFCIDMTDMKWEMLPTSGSIPGGRAAHSAAAFRGHLYIFGGMDPTGALDTMYRYHIEKSHWTHLEFKTPLPPARLDHSMCIIPWKSSSNHQGCDPETRGDYGQKEAGETSNQQHMCIVFGGMDIKGKIYRDCIASLLE